MKKLTLIISLTLVMISLLSACAVPVTNTAEPSAVQSAVTDSGTPTVTDTVSESATPAVTETVPADSISPSAAPPKNDIINETKEYILHGQDDLPEAGKLHWTQAILDQVDIGAVYEKYLADGGKAEDIKSFAEYLTLNAPVPDNWKELFEADLLKEYEVTPSRYEALGDDYYQVYVVIDGKEVPYVAVNARTGYFHG